MKFISGCNISNCKNKYFYSKARYYWQVYNVNTIKTIMNRIKYILDLKFRKGYALIDNKKYYLR